MIDQMMKNPADTDFVYFALTFDIHDPIEILVGVTKKYVACLIANLVHFPQTELSSVALVRKPFGILQNVPIRSLGVFRSQLMTSNVAFHPPPFRLSNVQHQSTD